MSLLMIGMVTWLLLAVFACSLGRAARAGDRAEVARVRVPVGARAAVEPPAHPLDGLAARARPASAQQLEDWFRRELFDARRALRDAEARVAQLEGQQRIGAA